MTFLEPIIASIIGAAVTALAVFLKTNITAKNFLKYGDLVKKAYDIVDPILDQNLHNWDGSKIDKAFELAVESVADGELTSEEIKKLAFQMAKDWLPAVAADKVRKLESTSPELAKAAEIASKVGGIVG
jgi:hypothetical protein